MASPEKIEAIQKKIAKQMKYYFGDQNLPRDKFLLQKIEEDDGWVPLDCILTFPRMKAIAREIIGESLRAHGSDLLEVDETNVKVRRVKPLPELNDEYRSMALEKAVYCKGFPITSTLDEIEGFFEDKGKCLNIKMRRNNDEDKTFKGSVFVDFETKEEASAFVTMKALKYKDNPLIYMSKKDYFNSKKVEKSSGDKKPNGVERQTNEAKVKVEDVNPKGGVVHFSGAGDQTSREDLKEIFNLEGISVAWVDFSKGDKEGFIRYHNSGDGEKAMKAVLEKHENKLCLRGVETVLRVIDGDEETKYWEKVKEQKERMRRHGKPSQRGHRKRGRDGTRGGPPVKQVKK